MSCCQRLIAARRAVVSTASPGRTAIFRTGPGAAPELLSVREVVPVRVDSGSLSDEAMPFDEAFSGMLVSAAGSAEVAAGCRIKVPTDGWLPIVYPRARRLSATTLTSCPTSPTWSRRRKSGVRP